MQPSLSTQPQPEPENNYPDCLYLELEGIPVQSNSQEHLEFWTTSTQQQQVDLLLTLHFNEQWETLDKGRVKFGLKGGELRLKLNNGEIPHESRALVGFFELYPLNTTQELQSSQARQHKHRCEFAIAPSAPTTAITVKRNRSVSEARRSLGAMAPQEQHEAIARSRLRNSDSRSRESVLKRSGSPQSIASSLQKTTMQERGTVSTAQKSGQTGASVTVCHVTTKVTEENPVWIFEEEMGEYVLRGWLHKATLATLNVLALPCRVEATFEVSKRDLCLTEAEGLWPPDISRNKRAVLDRLIIQHLLEPKLKPYLSRAELHYD
jgi:hypothetical protein